jgi:hypothetical protein
MSALGGKADLTVASLDFRFWSEAKQKRPQWQGKLRAEAILFLESVGATTKVHYRRSILRSASPLYFDQLLGFSPDPLTFRIFPKVVNIDHRLLNSEAHAGSITAPPSASIGD